MAIVYHATRTHGHLVRWMAFFHPDPNPNPNPNPNPYPTPNPDQVRRMAFFDVDEFVRLSPRYASLHSVLAHVLDAAQVVG